MDEKTKTIEERFAAIDKILERIENPEVSLDESFELYKAGMAELQAANATIEQTKKAVVAINQNGNLSVIGE